MYAYFVGNYVLYVCVCVCEWDLVCVCLGDAAVFLNTENHC